jgi:hypothetical protein
VLYLFARSIVQDISYAGLVRHDSDAHTRSSSTTPMTPLSASPATFNVVTGFVTP